MNRSILFSLTALTVTAFADDEVTTSKCPSASKKAAAYQPSMVVLSPAAPKSDCGWFVFADALYWHASEGNTDWATQLSSVGQKFKLANYKLDFKWSWGFKVGLGVNTHYDGWDSVVYYTWFETDKSDSVTASAHGVVSATHDIVTILQAGGPNSSTYKMNIHYSMFDWELGRAYHVGKKFSVRPHAGVKGGWIHQGVNQKYIYPEVPGNPTEFAEKDKNNFWGVGVSGGVNTDWKIGRLDCHQFSLFGDFAGALMYGHFDTDFNVKAFADSVQLGEFVSANFDRNLAVPMLQAMLGLMWDTGFNQDRCHFGLKVGYEFQYWFRQNQMVSFLGSSGFSSGGKSFPLQYQRLSDDLALQGLTIDVRFDF